MLLVTLPSHIGCERKRRKSKICSQTRAERDADNHIPLSISSITPVRTIDTGGAGPVTGILEAVRMIRMDWCETVAVVAGDAVSSLTKEEFLKRADQVSGLL